MCFWWTVWTNFTAVHLFVHMLVIWGKSSQTFKMLFDFCSSLKLRVFKEWDFKIWMRFQMTLWMLKAKHGKDLFENKHQRRELSKSALSRYRPRGQHVFIIGKYHLMGLFLPHSVTTSVLILALSCSFFCSFLPACPPTCLPSFLSSLPSFSLS